MERREIVAFLSAFAVAITTLLIGLPLGLFLALEVLASRRTRAAPRLVAVAAPLEVQRGMPDCLRTTANADSERAFVLDGEVVAWGSSPCGLRTEA
jgi:hypothetical protein